jgi:hypothetical protein
LRTAEGNGSIKLRTDLLFISMSAFLQTMLENRRPIPLMEVMANMIFCLPSTLVFSRRRMCWKSSPATSDYNRNSQPRVSPDQSAVKEAAEKGGRPELTMAEAAAGGAGAHAGVGGSGGGAGVGFLLSWAWRRCGKLIYSLAGVRYNEPCAEEVDD